MDSRTLGKLAEHVDGKVIGDPNIKIKAAASLEMAQTGDISFLTNRKYTNLLQTTKASAVVVGSEINAPPAMLITQDPYYAFRQIVVLLHGHRKHKQTGISDNASIAKTAKIGADCNISQFVTVSDNAIIGDRCVLYPGVFVGNETEIGDDCILYPNAVIYNKCKIANRVIIHANATIGEDGFGFATHNATHHKIPHIGRVIIEDDVEIGAGSAIERGTLDDTVIGTGCKIGDSVVVGHGSKIGPHSLIVPQVGLAGSVTLGHHCVIGGQSAIVGHANVGNCVMLGGQSGITNDVPDGKTLFGTPAFDAKKAKLAYAMIKYLPEMRRAIRKLEKKLKTTDDPDK